MWSDVQIWLSGLNFIFQNSSASAVSLCPGIKIQIASLFLLAVQDGNEIQGWTKITFPVSVNMRWNNCAFLPATGVENAIFSPRIQRTWEGYFSPALYRQTDRAVPPLSSWNCIGASLGARKKGPRQQQRVSSVSTSCRKSVPPY